MPKIKVARKSTSVDMTAMCDVSFLLLTFFMLTSKFRPAEAVPIDLPNSRSQIKLADVMTITVAKDGAAFFSLAEAPLRAALLDRMLVKHPEIKLDVNQKKAFEGLDMFGFSLQQMPQVLAMNPVQYKAFKKTGIPKDSANCELVEWVHEARYVNQDLKIAIKGDKDVNIKDIKQVIYGLTELIGEHRFNLITSLSGSSQKGETKKEGE